MKQLILILLLLPSVLFAQSNRALFHSMNGMVVDTTTPPPVVGKDTIRINFATTSQSVSSYNNMSGNPHSAVISNSALVDYKGTTTAVGLTTIGTANWFPYSGVSSNNPCCSITGAPFYGTSANTAAVGGSNFFNYGATGVARYTVGFPQFRITGLKTTSTYEIKITNIDGNLGFNALGLFRAVGLTSSTVIAVDGNVLSQTVGATFNLQPKVDGTIEIWANTNPTGSGDLVMIPAIFITEQ